MALGTLTIDPLVSVAGLIVGFIVGMTGMGGGALMTPILVAIFRVHPLTAIGSDLVSSLVMKPVGVAVHWRRGTVERGIVWRLLIGSVPAAFAGVFAIRMFGSDAHASAHIQQVLGGALLLASGGILLRSYLIGRRRIPVDAAEVDPPTPRRTAQTILIGAAVGFVVGMTSVGSGSLMIVLLMLVYPKLTGRRLVGTDLAQAVPLVASAALGHVLLGDFSLGLTSSILVGSIPGVYLGSRFSARARDLTIRPILVFVLSVSAIKLLGAGNSTLLACVIALALVIPPLWALIDVTRWDRDAWTASGRNRTFWAAMLTFGTLPAAIAYFSRVRPALDTPRPEPASQRLS